MTDNDEQARFWSEDAGPNWVARMSVMDQTLAPVLDAVLDSAALQPGEKVIDVGCGAGTSTFAAASRVGPEGKALGVDISASLLAAARARSAINGNVAFELADAQEVSFQPVYDCLISRFGVMFFADPVAAFENLKRALVPAGRMAFATWGAIEQNPYFTLPSKVAQQFLGRLEKSDPDLPGPFAFRDPERVLSVFAQAGLVEGKVIELSMLLTPPGTTKDVAELLCDIGSAQRILLQLGTGASDRARLVEVLSEALEVYDTPEGLRIPAGINLFTARKPA